MYSGKISPFLEANDKAKLSVTRKSRLNQTIYIYMI
ncbi:Uncharacterised protein [Citrobacter werkmanii]|nr:Uncharacterised protein [Citrobacter werkmanii]